MYQEPELSILILDYAKPLESEILLRSIEEHVKVPHKIVFCDNGSGETYSQQFLEQGLIDQLIINKESLGLGIGTRDLFASCTTKYALYVQNDQYFFQDFTAELFEYLKLHTGNSKISDGRIVKTMSLAGYPCGKYIFSERAFFVETAFYKSLEPLTLGGAGFLHHLKWREQEIQELYTKAGYVHAAGPQVVQDNGVFAVRDLRKSKGGVWCHRTDTKQLWCIVKPSIIHTSYPNFTEVEKDLVQLHGWPDSRIPEKEIAHSFDCWSQTYLGQHEKEYLENLRKRFN